MPERNIITDKLLLEKTGETLEFWFKKLDDTGAKLMSHLEIFNLVSNTNGLAALGEWNQNLLTTTYEWNRGIKERGQKGDLFEISVSKTVEVPVALLYRYFVEDDLRKQWLSNRIVIRKATENKSARVTWSDEITSLSIDFYPKGDSKSQIVVQHQKIPDKAMADEMKMFWNQRLEAFAHLLKNQ